MQFIPIDVMNTQPQSGGGGLPDGWYIMQVTDANEVAPEQNGQFLRRNYKCKVLMGPGQSEELKGRPYPYRIRENDPGWAGRHMELYVACFGSVDAVRQIAQQNGGGITPNLLQERVFIAQLGKSGNYTNVIQALPYTTENWAAATSGNGAPTQAAAPTGGMLTQAVAPAQPAMPVPAAPVQGFVPPQQPTAQPGLPQMPGSFAAPAMPQPGVPQTQPAMAVPTPPPPPGPPATGK